MCEYFSGIYLKKKLELEKAEANIAEFIRMAFNSVTFHDYVYKFSLVIRRVCVLRMMV